MFYLLFIIFYELPPLNSKLLEVVVSYRNIVAHGERTFCARLPKTRLSTSLGIVKKMQIPKNSKGENIAFSPPAYWRVRL